MFAAGEFLLALFEKGFFLEVFVLFFLPPTLRGIIAFTLIALNTICIFSAMMFVAVFKLVFRIPIFQKFATNVLVLIASQWVNANALILFIVNRIHIDVHGVDTLDKSHWYLVVSNHQSWVDILVLQTILRGRIPFLKFFLKKELIWVPLMGLAWWALDFPFMKRYSKAFLEKNPHLKGQDIAITRKACEKFKSGPISVMNFVEGTRFTKGKHQKQKSPYTHLLRPKAGGVAFVLAAMGDYLNSFLNVTIAYPNGVGNFWDFLCGRIPEVRVRFNVIPITQEMLGDYENDAEFRNRFQNWVNALWREKDAGVAYLMARGTSEEVPFEETVIRFPRKDESIENFELDAAGTRL